MNIIEEKRRNLKWIRWIGENENEFDWLKWRDEVGSAWLKERDGGSMIVESERDWLKERYGKGSACNWLKERDEIRNECDWFGKMKVIDGRKESGDGREWGK